MDVARARAQLRDRAHAGVYLGQQAGGVERAGDDEGLDRALVGGERLLVGPRRRAAGRNRRRPPRWPRGPCAPDTAATRPTLCSPMRCRAGEVGVAPLDAPGEQRRDRRAHRGRAPLPYPAARRGAHSRLPAPRMLDIRSHPRSSAAAAKSSWNACTVGLGIVEPPSRSSQRESAAGGRTPTSARTGRKAAPLSRGPSRPRRRRAPAPCGGPGCGVAAAGAEERVPRCGRSAGT